MIALSPNGTVVCARDVVPSASPRAGQGSVLSTSSGVSGLIAVPHGSRRGVQMLDEVIDEVTWVGVPLAMPGEVAAEGEVDRSVGDGQDERGDPFAITYM